MIYVHNIYKYICIKTLNKYLSCYSRRWDTILASFVPSGITSANSPNDKRGEQAHAAERMGLNRTTMRSAVQRASTGLEELPKYFKINV